MSFSQHPDCAICPPISDCGIENDKLYCYYQVPVSDLKPSIIRAAAPYLLLAIIGVSLVVALYHAIFKKETKLGGWTRRFAQLGASAIRHVCTHIWGWLRSKIAKNSKMENLQKNVADEKLMSQDIQSGENATKEVGSVGIEEKTPEDEKEEKKNPSMA